MTTTSALTWFEPWPATIDALAAYRITRLLVSDQLPPLTRLRTRLYQQTAAKGERGPAWAQGWVCAWCAGFWVALLLVGLHTLVAGLGGETGSHVVTLLALPWAIAAVIGVLADHQAT